MNPFDSPMQNWLFLHNRCSLSKVLNQNLNLKFHQMSFFFEFLNIHMNEKTTSCYDFHSFKWKNINISLILIFFLCDLTPFLAHWIMIATISYNILYGVKYMINTIFYMNFLKIYVLQNLQTPSLVFLLYWSICNIYFEICLMYVSVINNFSKLHHPHMNLYRSQI
jgi:hypothetical protein